MHLNTFETDVPEIILQRGENYYEDGAVIDLQDMDNGQWFAIVEGNYDYEVDIQLDKNDEVLDYACNCPYDGPVCKHVVAVLYQIREEKQDNTKPEKKSIIPSDWKNIISVVPEEELRKFALEYAIKNKDFRNKLMISFSEYDKKGNQLK